MSKKTAAQMNREIAASLAGESGGSLYQDLLTAGIPTDHHESDLYVLDTPVARALIARHGKRGTTFTSQVDRKRWIDVPFAYDPFWKNKQQPYAHATAKRQGASGTWAVEAGRGLTYDRGDGRGAVLMFNLHRYVHPQTSRSAISPVELDEITHEIAAFLA